MILRRIFIGLLLFIPLLVFIPGMNDFAYPLGSSYSDLTISHYPNLVFLRQSLSDGNGIPLWSNTILSGFPFAANPLSGLWYPPGWLLFWLPLPAGFNVLILVHSLWGSLGMYLLLRQRKVQVLPALAGALTYELFPKLFSHFGAGHVTLLFAVSWTPWLLLAEHLQQTFPGRKIRLVPAILLGMIILADVRWGIYAGILWSVYSLYLLFSHGYNRKALLQWVKYLSAQAIVAGLIAAPILLPLFEYANLSTRQMLTAEESLIFSLPLTRLLGLLYPDLAGYAEWMIYPGAFGLLLSIFAMFHSELRSRNRFWIWAMILSLLAALGPGIPVIGDGLRYIAQLPLLNLLRVPTRSIFIMGIALAVLTAEALDYLSKESRLPVGKKRNGSGPLLVGLTAFSVLLALGIYFISGNIPVEFVWGAAALSVFCALFLFRQSNRISGKAWMAILLPLLILDIGGVSYFQISYRKPGEVLAEGEAAASYLKSQRGDFRIYSPSYSIPQQTASVMGLQLADGIDPMILRNYSHFMDMATGVPRDGYSVTLPPLEGDNIHTANRGYLPDARLLGLLNVKYIVAEFPLEVSGLLFLQQLGSTWIYENEYALPRAWLQNESEPIGTNVQAVQVIELKPNRIVLNVSGKGLLVLSELDYPGWQVQVNGKKAEVQPVMNLLRGVRLSETDNQVVFSFRPVSVYAGIILAIAGWALTLYSIRKVFIDQ
jgi:hypothetical protein